MQLDLLHTFLVVSETQGFSAAAHVLNLTQSAVSLQIKRLEEQLGVSLFDRTSRSVELTEEGGAFLAYARQIVLLEAEARERVRGVRQRPSLRIGMPDEQAEFFLPRVLPAFTRAFPKIRLSVTCGISRKLVQSYQQGELDVVLAIRHDGMPRGELVAVSQLVWVAAVDLNRDPSAVVPLALNPEGCLYRASALRALTEAGVLWDVAFVSESPAAINTTVASGLAVTVKSERTVPEGCRILGQADQMPALPRVDIELHRTATALGPEVETFVQLLTEAVQARARALGLVGG